MTLHLQPFLKVAFCQLSLTANQLESHVIARPLSPPCGRIRRLLGLKGLLPLSGWHGAAAAAMVVYYVFQHQHVELICFQSLSSSDNSSQ